MSMTDKKHVNPAIIGFIAGTEGEAQAELDVEWAKKMAQKYDVDATTVLLYGKTYGKENVEKILAKKKATEQGELEIYLSDLTPEAQKRVLAFLGIKTAEEGNLDVYPIATIPKPTP